MQKTALNDRFEAVARLYSTNGLARLQTAHVCVIGLGGVGSWAVEALARSGIGKLTLVDLDEICVSNINRQLHALPDTVGRSKVKVLAERIRAINSSAIVYPHETFFTEATAAELLRPRFDYVIDAIDSTEKKCLMIVRCRELGIPIITAGAAGGRKDSASIRITDLGRATHDRLLDAVRRKLRREYGFPKGAAEFGIPCVHSIEPARFGFDDTGCERRLMEPGIRLDCEGGYGSACHVTGAFGFAAAGQVISELCLRG